MQEESSLNILYVAKARLFCWGEGYKDHQCYRNHLLSCFSMWWILISLIYIFFTCSMCLIISPEKGHSLLEDFTGQTDLFFCVITKQNFLKLYVCTSQGSAIKHMALALYCAVCINLFTSRVLLIQTYFLRFLSSLWWA